MPELIVLIVLLGAGIGLWLSLRNTKPIGDLPYLWGKWCGICSIVGAVYCLVALPEAAAKGGAPIVLLLLAVASAFAGVGLLQRRRYGVIAFFISYLLVEILLLAALVMGTEKELGRLLAFLICTWINFIYFRKRWKWMGGAPEGVSLEQER